MRSPSLILWAKKSFQASEIVPKRYKRDSKKETEGASKFCHQGGAWVDQFLSLHPGPISRGAQYINGDISAFFKLSANYQYRKFTKNY